VSLANSSGVDLRVLAQSLYARRDEAVVVPYEEKTMTDGPPSENECHINADRWVQEHRDHKTVRGWLVFDRLLGSRLCRFNAHSVVEAPDGRLFDLTPSRASRRYPFLRHEGPGEFEEILGRIGLVHLDYDPAENKICSTSWIATADGRERLGP